MKRLPLVIFVLIALAQLSVPALLAWNRVQTLNHGRVWKFKTAPVDPEDAVRGRYVSLAFDVEQFPRSERIEWNTPVYVALKADAEGFAAIDQISETPLRGDNVIRAQAAGWWDGKQHLTFPFRQYWVTEKIAPQAEQAYRDNSRRDKLNAFVTVRARNGDAALEQLYIDNQPLTEFLRAQAAKK